MSSSCAKTFHFTADTLWKAARLLKSCMSSSGDRTHPRQATLSSTFVGRYKLFGLAHSNLPHNFTAGAGNPPCFGQATLLLGRAAKGPSGKTHGAIPSSIDSVGDQDPEDALKAPRPNDICIVYCASGDSAAIQYLATPYQCITSNRANAS